MNCFRWLLHWISFGRYRRCYACDRWYWSWRKRFRCPQGCHDRCLDCGAELTDWFNRDQGQCDECYYGPLGLSQCWLCQCGNYIENGMHCPDCGAEPPWGCDCGCQDEYVEEDPDPYYTEEYQAFVASQAEHCRCAGNRPCDGVLAGGPCDDIQDDYTDEQFEWDLEHWDDDDAPKDA